MYVGQLPKGAAMSKSKTNAVALGTALVQTCEYVPDVSTIEDAADLAVQWVNDHKDITTPTTSIDEVTPLIGQHFGILAWD